MRELFCLSMCEFPLDIPKRELLHAISEQQFFRATMKKWGWKDSIAGKVLVLHLANPNSLPGIPYGPLNITPSDS